MAEIGAVPSPVSANELSQMYDASVLQLNDHPEAEHTCSKLLLVCCIFLAANVLTDYQQAVVESTARRALLLQRLVRLGQGDNTGDDGVLPAVQVSAHASTNKFEWSMEDDRTSLVLSKAELSAEEDILLHMANTPIPTSSTTTQVSRDVTQFQALLKEEWGATTYQRVLDQI